MLKYIEACVGFVRYCGWDAGVARQNVVKHIDAIMALLRSNKGKVVSVYRFLSAIIEKSRL